MRLRILISYHYYKGTDLDEFVAKFPEPPEIFADSGGFSAWSLGEKISPDAYAGWLHRWSKHITTYANLDAIGDPAGTKSNQASLESMGLSPIPVHHAGSPAAGLEEYCERYPYVALGGMVPIDAGLALRWAAGCFKIGRRYDTRFHGFGQTSIKVLKALPWYTVDSSSWGNGHRFGTVQCWDDKTARFVQIRVGNHREVYDAANLIRSHGFDPSVFAERGYGKVKGTDKDRALGREERAYVIAMNVTAWLRLEAWLRRHHGAVTPPRGWERPGPQIQLSMGGAGVSDQIIPNPDGPKIQLSMGGGPQSKAEYLTDAGPKIMLADSADDLPRCATDLTYGPRIHLAEGAEDNLIMAGQAAANLEEDNP